jgi:hypothetical protein
VADLEVWLSEQARLFESADDKWNVKAIGREAHAAGVLEGLRIALDWLEDETSRRTVRLLIDEREKGGG